MAVNKDYTEIIDFDVKLLAFVAFKVDIIIYELVLNHSTLVHKGVQYVNLNDRLT